MIDEHTLKTLEFPKIITLIEGNCRTPYGHEQVRLYTPAHDKDEIDRRLTEIDQMKDIISFGRAFPLSRMEDCRELLDQSRVEGTFVPPEDILKILELIEVSIDINGYNPEERDKFPAVADYIERVRAFPELRIEIRKAIDDDGNIKDNASAKLKHIRMDLISTRDKIMHQLERILSGQKKQAGWQDDVITMRNGRYVIPIPANQYRGDVGMLHDRSQSGATYYVEPKETVEVNNKLHLLQQEERVEIDRILRALTAEISSRANALEENTELIGKLDAIYSAAAFARQTKANRPTIVDTPGFDLKDARHPLLMVQFKDQSQVVPISISLGDERQAIIITGPNTGGKTIAVKTVGLLVLMAQSGLLIPADEKSQLGLFQKVFADIGDEQSIELSLSTFSSHIRNIIRAIDRVSDDTLVLFDEIGAGTDPKEGAALAEAIILHVVDTGARLLATTHYSQLKTLPLEHPEIENASLEFDRKTLAPTYNLQIGIPGSSYAVEIASRLGMADSISKHAARLLGKGERTLTELIASLETELGQVRNDRATLTERLEKAKQHEVQYRTLSEKLARDIETEKEQALSETLALLDNTRRETERLVAEIRQNQAKGKSVKELHGTLQKRKEQVKKAQRQVEARRAAPLDQVNFEVGDTVRIISLNKEGDITELLGQTRARVRVGNVVTTVEVRNLEKLAETRSGRTKIKNTATNTSSDMDPEIHLRGMTSEEATDALDRFIDHAVVSGLKQIYVIHGKGTGKLRRSLTDFLKNHPEIASLRLGNWNEGGAGVTIAKLKE